MHDQSNGFKMVMGGVNRSVEFRRETAAGQRSSVALLVAIALLTATTGWFAGIAITQQVVAGTLAAAALPHHANLQPADHAVPPVPGAYAFP